MQLALGTERSRIVTRRIDTVECIDASTIRRRVECHVNLTSLDRALGSASSRPGSGPLSGLDWLSEGDIPLPLTRQPRSVAGTTIKGNTTFTVVDEAGAPLPRLTKREERDLILSGVDTSAQKTLGRPPSKLTRALIGEIVTGTLSPQRLAQIDLPDQGLVQDVNFQAVLREAHERYFLIVVLPAGGNPRRRVISYWFDQQLGRRPTSRTKRILFPKTDEVADVETPGFADCQSYHLEFVAPPDLAIATEHTQMAITRDGTSVPDRVEDDDPSHGRAHFYYEGARASDLVDVTVRMMLAKTGLSFSMDAAALVASGLLIHVATLSLWGPSDAFSNAEAWVTILLAAPAVATAIVAIRSVHRMTSRVSRDKRMTLVLPAFVLFCAAVAIAAPPAAIILTYLCTISLGAACLTVWRVVHSGWATRRLRSETT